MAIRVTITKPGVTDGYGIAMAVGTTYTVEENFGLSLIQQGRASDTDNVLGVIANEPFLSSPTYTSESFGIQHDGTDETLRLQQAIDALWAANGDHGAVIVFPAGKSTVCQGIILRPGVSIISNQLFANLTETSREYWGHRFTLPTMATQPLFQNDTENGYIRQYSNDSPQLPQRYSGSVLAGLTLMGSQNTAKHTTDADLIRLTRAWCVTIFGCSGISSRGFGMRILDCNAVIVTQSNFLAAPVFVNNTADSIFTGGQFGLGNGLASCPFWVSGGTQKNQFSNIFIYNNNKNGQGIGITTRQYAYPMVVASVARDVDANPNTVLFATLTVPNDNSHRWTTGTPVTVSSTGTLPAGLVADTTYYAVVINSGRIAFATTPVRALAGLGQIVSLTTVGSGTITVQVGENANLYVNDGSTQNRFTTVRLDQAFGSAMLVGNAPANAYQDITAQEGSFGNYVGYQIPGEAGPQVAPTVLPAIVFRNSSTQSTLGGTWTVNGVKTGTFDSATGQESRQKYGVSVDATSLVGTVISDTVNSFNHTEVNSEAGAANWTPSNVNPNRFTVAAPNFANISSCTATTFGGGRRVGWSMGADTVDGFVGTEIQLPFGWEDVDITIYWVASSANTGNVAWALQMAGFLPGEDTNIADPVTTSTAVSAVGGNNFLVATTLTAIDFSQFIGEQVYIRVKHAGADALNTYADAPILSHVTFTKV